MAKFQYIGSGEHYQGLPMVDLDDAELTDEQVALLAMATERGYYQTVKDLLAADQTAQAQSLIMADLATGEKVSKNDIKQRNRATGAGRDSADRSGTSTPEDTAEAQGDQADTQ